MFRKSCLTIVMLFSCTGALAEGYIGLGVGSVDYGLDAGTDFGDATGFEVIGGMEIDRNLSFEFSYIDFGEAVDSILPPPWRLTGDAITAGMLLRAKAGKTADIFFKLGMFSWDEEINEDGAGLVGTNDGTDVFYGFGVMIKTGKKFSLGARYNSYDFDGDDGSMLSINAQLGF